MKPFPISDERFITSGCMSKYRGMAFDGCHFYLTLANSPQALQLDTQFCPTRVFDTCRAYASICFDTKDNCFWATAGIRPILYKLDKDMRETERLYIPHMHGCDSAPLGISYDGHNDTIITAFAGVIAKVFKDCRAPEIIKENRSDWFSGVLSLSPYFITTEICKKAQTVSIFSPCGTLVKAFCTPEGVTVDTILFAPCSFDTCCVCYKFFVLGTKRGGYPYIFEVCILRCELEEGIRDCTFKLPCKHCGCCTHHISGNRHAHGDSVESLTLIETCISHLLSAETEKPLEITTTSDSPEVILEADEGKKKKRKPRAK